MDTTDPDISFDDYVVCSHCHRFEASIRPIWSSVEQGRSMLSEMIQRVRKYGSKKTFDCIIGLSGGVDSSYLAVKVAEWGLRPLVVHVDAGWNSELAVKNIEQICRRLGFDLVTHVVDWEIMKELQLSFLRSGVANQDTPQDHAFFAALYSYAAKARIKYIFSGSNYATESVLPSAWGYDAMDATHLRAIHRMHGKCRLTNFPIAGFFSYFIGYPMIHKLEVLRPLDCIQYSKAEAIAILERSYGWRYYGGKHYESRWTRFFQAFYLPYKFGYDKRKAHLSSLILSGQITRDAALKALEEPLYEQSQLEADQIFVAKKLGISMQEFRELIDQPVFHSSHYPSHQSLLKILKYLYHLPRDSVHSIKRRLWPFRDF